MSFKKIIYPYGLQFLTLSAVVIFFILASQENSFAEVNVGMLFFWNFWWPVVIFIVLFLGRFWCSICPYSAIANIVKRVFPYTIFKTDWFKKYGLFTSILFYFFIVGTNVAFAIESNADYTIVFVGGMFAIMVLMIILFGYKSYCHGACPVGLFLNIYEPVTFNRLEYNENVCTRCKKQSWVTEKSLLTTATSEKVEERDWRYRIECLKKCRKEATVMKFGNPFRSWEKDNNPTLIQVFAPGIVLLIFAVSLFEKSNFFLYLYEQVTSIFPISLAALNLMSIPLIVILIISANILFLRLFCRVLAIDPRVIYKKLGGLVFLLVLFHLALVLDEFGELGGLFRVYPILEFFRVEVQTFGIIELLPYVLIGAGILITFLYGLAVANTSEEQSFDKRKFGLSLFLFTVILGQFAFFALATLKILPYAAC